MKQGLVIKLKRIELGLSQDEFGNAIGVSRQSVSLYERGKLIPRPEKMKKISDVLKVPVQELFFNTDYY
ncbi:helix-turn-helix transcriptional regulator [Clostridium sp. UBA4548]|uniref:helix-turn-helix transcriptional regulator n=1 Tax=Clostridium sp. UBA4548 TaxID=1946361 RepID=UPI0025C245DD|nr:helix-turn-helix transcriptional regulator [Clostridium sp. UBA4548]